MTNQNKIAKLLQQREKLGLARELIREIKAELGLREDDMYMIKGQLDGLNAIINQRIGQETG